MKRTRSNSERPDQAFRLRAVVHAGEVHYDRWSSYGEALDLACRLLDSASFKNVLRRVREPLAVVVSEDLHRSLVRQGYPGIDVAAYEKAVEVRLGADDHAGWVQVPGYAPRLLLVDVAEVERGRAGVTATRR
ncbi:MULTISPECIES: hypothetical protein [Saccharothrix]|uniref:hypothetical protein n=1 Tax=Saccharothrix TaxID=2071 RepID=UPI0009403D56|nr:hypothetical protein [Saccharothrix sp. CB00851]OKI31322.1 hypothetical protein A6A25_27960 [Saccharothrix sp. CB00851]